MDSTEQDGEDVIEEKPVGYVGMIRLTGFFMLPLLIMFWRWRGKEQTDMKTI